MVNNAELSIGFYAGERTRAIFFFQTVLSAGLRR